MGNFTIHGLFFMLLKKLNRSHASTPSWAEICYFIYETNCCCLGCSNVASFPNCKKRHQMATLLGILSTESLGDFYGYCHCAIFLWLAVERRSSDVFVFRLSTCHVFVHGPQWLGSKWKHSTNLMWWGGSVCCISLFNRLGPNLPKHCWRVFPAVAANIEEISMSFSASGGPIASSEQEVTLFSVGKKSSEQSFGHFR